MDFVNEMQQAIQAGLEEFKDFIARKLKANPDYLKQYFWLPQKGIQMTVLNYLIETHQEGQENIGTKELEQNKGNLTDFIDYIQALSEDKDQGEPLHQALSSGKTELVFHLLGLKREVLEKRDHLNLLSVLKQLKNHSENVFDLDRRDNQGRTLISLILDLKLFELLAYLIAKAVNIHAATPMSGGVMFQPLHQAIVLESVDAIRLLGSHGAQLSNPLGVMKDTPLILAARLGKINALEVLLEFSPEQLNLEAENNNWFSDKKSGHTAMEELCERIVNNTEKEEAMRGIAMLLCHGAEPPIREKLRQLLSNNRMELLKAVKNYLEYKPELVERFVGRCHVRESTLHTIIYADHSWGRSIRHLFGMPSDAAFIVEHLVARKYDASQLEHSEGIPSSSTTAEHLMQEKNHIKLYAEFVGRYTKAYDSQLFTNRWSTMRWMIAEGNCNWQAVLEYAKNHPNSRTRIVLGEMLQPTSPIPLDTEEQDGEQDVEALSPGNR